MNDRLESVQKLPGKLRRLSFPLRQVAEETGQAGWTD